jgi:2-(1,2-epoxy-1,2-dihydrophenyl)acetyl-CoA isomerase
VDPETCQDLIEALRMLSGAGAVRVIVITGSGRAFCAGADLGVLESHGPALVAAGREIALAIRGAPKPVLAAVNGPAAGGGANLALACDYRVAADTASIGQVFHKLARMVPAPEALELGLFDRVVPARDLAAEARGLAECWAAMSPIAVRKTKAALYRSEGSSLAEMLDIEIADQHELFATAEARQLMRNR